MFDRFTDRAKKVMSLARQEAQKFNHEYIGTEHILLGLVKEGSGVGANVLKNLDVDFVERRFKEKRFAAGANRDQIRSCEDMGLSLNDFIALSLEAMQSIDDQLGL